MGGLTKLTKLGLCHNRIARLSERLGNLKWLQVLTLTLTLTLTPTLTPVTSSGCRRANPNPNPNPGPHFGDLKYA